MPNASLAYSAKDFTRVRAAFVQYTEATTADDVTIEMVLAHARKEINQRVRQYEEENAADTARATVTDLA